MDQLRLILLIAGVVIIILIYIWGMRARIKAKLRERRRRAAARMPENEPVLDEQGNLSADAADHSTGDIGRLASENDPFADQRLVDVEITPIRRPSSETNRQETQETPTAETTHKKATADTLDKPAVRPANKPSKERTAAKPAEEALKEPEKVVLLTLMAPPGQPFRGRNIARVAQELDLKLSDTGIYECLADSDKEKGKPVFGIANILEPGTFDPDKMEALSSPGLLVFMRLPGPVDSVTATELLLTTTRQLAQRLGGMVCDERRNKLTTQAIVHLKSEIGEFERQRRLWVHRQRG